MLLLTGGGLLALLVVGALAFVNYFLHDPYEVERELTLLDVPAPVLTSFAKRFPGASDIEWEQDDELYEAEFGWPDQDETEACFTEDGAWAKTEWDAAFSDLPPRAQEYLQGLKGKEVDDVVHIRMPNSPVVFEVDLKGKVNTWEYHFDAEGNLVASKRDGSVFQFLEGDEE